MSSGALAAGVCSDAKPTASALSLTRLAGAETLDESRYEKLFSYKSLVAGWYDLTLKRLSRMQER